MNSFGSFILNDWYVAIPMICMSMTGVTLVVWRLLLNANGSTPMSKFLPQFQERLDKDGPEGALRFCRARTDVIPKRLYVAGLENYKLGLAAVRRAMANAAELEIVPDLNFLLPSILAIAKIATMVGLLGTVISMINVFDYMRSNFEDKQGQAERMGLALFATALGLVTAIPLVFAHVLIKAWIGRFETRMKAATIRLVTLLQTMKTKKPTSPEAIKV